MSDQPRRPRPMGAPPAPRAASPAIAVVLAILAAAVGFLILKQFDKDSKGGSTTTPSEQTDDSASETNSTEPTGSGAVATQASSTTATPVAVNPATFQVIVVNASGVPKSAAALSGVLSQQAGLNVGTPANVLDTVTKYDVTKVYYIAGAEAQAAYVAQKLNWGITPEPLPAEPIMDSAAIGTASVVIALGKDRAQSALGGPASSAPAVAAGPTSVQPPPGVTG